MTLTTMLDMSDDENLKDARFYLDRAVTERLLAQWASKYGRALIERKPPDDHTEDWKEAEAECEVATNKAASLVVAIERAVQLIDLIPTRRTELDAIVTILEAEL